MTKELLRRLVELLIYRQYSLIAEYMTGDFENDLLISLNLLTGRKWVIISSEEINFE